MLDLHPVFLRLVALGHLLNGVQALGEGEQADQQRDEADAAHRRSALLALMPTGTDVEYLLTELHAFELGSQDPRRHGGYYEGQDQRGKKVDYH